MITMEDTEKVPETRVSGMVAADGSALKTATVVFHGRTMVVVVPDEVQLSIMKKFATRYSAITDDSKVPVSQAVAMSGKAISVLQSVLADEEDKDWIEECLLEKVFKLDAAMVIIQEAMDALREANQLPENREERRKSAKKAKLLID